MNRAKSPAEVEVELSVESACSGRSDTSLSPRDMYTISHIEHVKPFGGPVVRRDAALQLGRHDQSE
jgi:hypothetical protein